MALVSLAVPSPASAQLIEEFTQPATGNTLGSCGQLTISNAGSGSVSVSGNGVAQISTPSEADAAFIRSTTPLPSTYKITVKLQNVSYHKYTAENGVTLLAITNGVPTPGTETAWLNRRLVGVEVDSKPDFINDSSIFVNYWNSSGAMHTWDGGQWGQADDYWNPYFAPYTNYVVELEKTASNYVITVSADGAQLTRATVSVASVAGASTEYLVVGDRITDFFRGSIAVDAITMPGTCNGPTPDGAGLSDAGPQGDAVIWAPVEGGPTYYDSGSPRPNARPGTPMACDCRLADAPSSPSAVVLTLLCLLALLVVRRTR